MRAPCEPSSGIEAMAGAVESTDRFPLQPGTAVCDYFETLCRTVAANQIPLLHEKVDAIVERFAQSETNTEHARAIGEKCHLLLNRYHDSRETEQALIVGAVRYFLFHGDGLADSTPLVGFADDALVLNHVLEQLGIEGEFLDFGR